MTLDASVHCALLTAIVERGHAPSNDELARVLAVETRAVESALQRLADGHGLVLHPQTAAVWVAHPFSLSPTNVWVAAERGGGWWAPCLWCAFGVATLVKTPVTIHARLGGEAEAIAIAGDGGGEGDELLVHFPIAPRDAWRNVIHYCATVQAFRRGEDCDSWCARHGFRVGAVVTMGRVRELARRWYGAYLDRDWKKWSRREAQKIFGEVGLGGEFWRLPVGGGSDEDEDDERY
jgi:alkylmercury lyase-like protein